VDESALGLSVFCSDTYERSSASNRRGMKAAKNPKFEYRNSKQIQVEKFKRQKRKTMGFGGALF
jgi:hypothetical protein